MGDFLNKNSMTNQQKKSLMKQLLEGLKELDEKKIVHRDLKPANIMKRRGKSEWVIIDVGLASQIE